MKEQLLKLKTEALNRLKECNDNADIEKIRIQYLGKKGELTAILSSMGSLSEEERGFEKKVKSFERAIIEEAINRNNGNKSAAARLLGISERHIRSIIERLDIKE